jgi:adenylate cyclase class IV
MNKPEHIPHLELEVKILEVDPADITQKLKAVGAEKIFHGLTFIEGFDFPPNEKVSFNADNVPTRLRAIFSQVATLSDGSRTLISQGAYLRLRKEGERSELILKWKDQKSKGNVKREHESSITINETEWEEVRNIVEQTGLNRILIQQKKRTSYVYHHFAVRFDIDIWPKLPPYLEVEGSSIEAISKGLKLIGFSMNEASSISGKELFEKYGVDPNYLVFEESDQ